MKNLRISHFIVTRVSLSMNSSNVFPMRISKKDFSKTIIRVTCIITNSSNEVVFGLIFQGKISSILTNMEYIKIHFASTIFIPLIFKIYFASISLVKRYTRRSISNRFPVKNHLWYSLKVSKRARICDFYQGVTVHCS